MAGIGYELRKLLQRDTLLGLLQAYAYAGIIASGPYVLSIVAMLLIGLFSFAVVVPDVLITRFQVTVTVLIAGSLILTGTVQLAFTRFVADRLFEKSEKIIVPNYHGLLLVTVAVAGVLTTLAMLFLFDGTTLLYRMLVISGATVLCAIWLATVFLSGMKEYKAIVLIYLLGYAVSVAGALALRNLNTEGLLAGFIIGQGVMFCAMQAIILRNFPSDRFMAFDCFQKRYRYPTLAWIGLLFNLGVWVDKFVFWYFPLTSIPVIGPLRASVIYDLPVFLAYLSIIPGMAVFLVRIETDFVENYDGFYSCVRGGGALELIERYRNGMVETVRAGLTEMAKVQAIAVLLLVVSGEALLRWLRISDLYLPLLTVHAIAAGLQVMFLAILTVYFYLDRRNVVLMLTLLFAVLNLGLSYLSLLLGPAYYGYGFAISLLVVVVIGMFALEKSLSRLEYSTFMLQ
jgi:polysaccharide biosynthesis protein PelG